MGQGSRGDYRRLVVKPEGASIVRTDLIGGADRSPGPRRRKLARFVHLTDMHVADPSSPVRFDFLEKRATERGWEWISPVHRPQEALTNHACIAMADTLARVVEDGVVIVTGDNIANAQHNELRVYLAALDGGRVRLPPYEGVQSEAWDDPWYWRPESADDDRMKHAWGFPTLPGLLKAATHPVDAKGVGARWLACVGNHDGLVVGTTAVTSTLADMAVRGAKATALASGFDPADPFALFLAEPEAFLSGPSMAISPDPDRRTITVSELVAAHDGRHGFGDEGRTYYTDDAFPGVRVIVLDTLHPPGHFDGSLDRVQLAWLEDELAKAAADGVLVVVASHHATPSLTNAYSPPRSPLPDRALAAEVLACLHRSPNVVMWLNGHHHRNMVKPRPAPDGKGGGFWEVTTSSIVDWPSQARLVEWFDNGDGTISALTTMIEHDAPVVPVPDGDPSRWCASVHREVAANVAFLAGRQDKAEGTPADRNVELVVPTPAGCSP